MAITRTDKMIAFAKEKLIEYKYYKYLPQKTKNSDIYIVEFPKSGVTWFSSIIANINLIESGSIHRATYYNISQIIPDVQVSRSIIDEPMWDIPKFRFIKSHYGYCPFYNHVIYLVRNPVSVMNSYYGFMAQRQQFSGSLMDFVKNRKYGVQAWKSHVEGWLNKPKSQRMHVLKFEDLRKNTLDAIIELYTNLGVGISSDTANEAIELVSLESMKQNESLYNKHDPLRKLQFVGTGKTAADMDASVRQYIISETKELLDILGYSIDEI